MKLAKHLETEGVQAAETGDVHKALDLFNQAINVLPSRASGYNNRAQALRLKGDVQGTCFNYLCSTSSYMYFFLYIKEPFINPTPCQYNLYT